MPDGTFVAPIDPGDPLDPRLRVRIVTVRGRVIDFSVQPEISLGARHLAVARYDGSRGSPHRDLLDRGGHDFRTTWLHGMPFDRALNVGCDDLRDNWRSCADGFMRREGWVS